MPLYAAVALQFGTTLITLDQKQRRRIATVLPTRRPREVGRKRESWA